MKFAPLWGPVQIFVGLLVPSYNFKKSSKPLQHNERQKIQNLYLKVGPPVGIWKHVFKLKYGSEKVTLLFGHP